MFPPRNCANCNVVYTPGSSTGKYCTERCCLTAKNEKRKAERHARMIAAGVEPRKPRQRGVSLPVGKARLTKRKSQATTLWSFVDFCNRCGKAIGDRISSKCYECATGRKRLITIPPERMAQVAA